MVYPKESGILKAVWEWEMEYSAKPPFTTIAATLSPTFKIIQIKSNHLIILLCTFLIMLLIIPWGHSYEHSFLSFLQHQKYQSPQQHPAGSK